MGGHPSPQEQRFTQTQHAKKEFTLKLLLQTDYAGEDMSEKMSV